MASDVLVTRVTDSLPELRCPRPIEFDENGDASDSPSDENRFNFPNKRSSNALPSITRMNDQAIHVAAPAIECSKDRTHEPPVRRGDEQRRGGIFNSPAQVRHVVCCAQAGA